MSTHDDLKQTFADICVLYELALASGGSLDPQADSERFLATLMARKGFAFASVWLHAKLLPVDAPEPAFDAGTSEEQLVLLYGAPSAHLAARTMSTADALWRTLSEQGAFSAASGDARLGGARAEVDLAPGIFAVLPLGELGLVKLYALGRDAPLDAVELSQLSTVVRKFASSLEGCLAHQRLRLEVAGRERAERDRAQAQAQLEQARKLEAVGRLAGGVAHDFNNLLVAVLGQAELLLREVSAASPLRNGLEAIAMAARRAASLTQQLLSFSRKDPGLRSKLRVDGLIYEVVELLGRTLDPRIRVEVATGAGDAALVGNVAQLHTVLLNLALNARDAMQHGGTLRIRSALVPPPAPAAAREVAADAPRQWVRIRVEDTGIGMAPDVIARVFEPFFTTKEIGQGTGLGMAAAYGIVKAHGGRIEVASELGVGTTVDVLLPTEGILEPTARTPSVIRREGRGVVLLVDDDRLSRHTLAEMLGFLGYSVRSVGSGRDAIEHCTTSAAPPCCILLDLRMPEMGGLETLRRLRAVSVSSPVVIISGLGDVGDERELSELGVAEVLQKPISLDQLADTLSRVSCSGAP